MHFPQILLAAIGAAILLPSALAQTTKCPTGQREHKDDNGKLWCMDSEGRSFEAEAPAAPTANNAPMTLAEKQEKPVVGGKSGDTIRMKNDKGQLEDCDVLSRFPDGKAQYVMCASDFLDTVEAQAAEDEQRGFKLPSCSGWGEDKRSHEEMYHGAVGAFNARNYDTAYCMAMSSYDSNFGPLYSPAQTLLGLLYSKKEFMGYDPVRAFKCFKDAAENNYYPQAEYLLSMAYKEGIGTEPDPFRAKIWMEMTMSTDEGQAIAAKAQQQDALPYKQWDEESAFTTFLGILIGSISWNEINPEPKLDACGHPVGTDVCVPAGKARQLGVIK